MTPTQNAINNLVYQFDQVAITYEARWGVGTLEALADEPLAEKVQLQVEKLNTAINDGDLDGVRDLVDGCIRMYDALEKNALSKGKAPIAPDFWEIQVDAAVYRVAKGNVDARALIYHSPHETVVVTLEDLVRTYAAKDKIFTTPLAAPPTPHKGEFDFEVGDSIDF